MNAVRRAMETESRRLWAAVHAHVDFAHNGIAPDSCLECDRLLDSLGHNYDVYVEKMGKLHEWAGQARRLELAKLNEEWRASKLYR